MKYPPGTMVRRHRTEATMKLPDVVGKLLEVQHGVCCIVTFDGGITKQPYYEGELKPD